MYSQLLNERQVATRLNVSVPTVQKWRFLRRGPAYVKCGRAVRYRPEDLEAFLESRRVDPGPKAA